MSHFTPDDLKAIIEKYQARDQSRVTGIEDDRLILALALEVRHLRCSDVWSSIDACDLSAILEEVGRIKISTRGCETVLNRLRFLRAHRASQHGIETVQHLDKTTLERDPSSIGQVDQQKLRAWLESQDGKEAFERFLERLPESSPQPTAEDLAVRYGNAVKDAPVRREQLVEQIAIDRKSSFRYACAACGLEVSHSDQLKDHDCAGQRFEKRIVLLEKTVKELTSVLSELLDRGVLLGGVEHVREHLQRRVEELR